MSTGKAGQKWQGQRVVTHKAVVGRVWKMQQIATNVVVTWKRTTCKRSVQVRAMRPGEEQQE